MTHLKHLLCILAIAVMQHPPAAAQTAIVTLTTYHAVAAECSGDPLTTADGTKIIPRHVKSGKQRIDILIPSGKKGTKKDKRENKTRQLTFPNDTRRIPDRYPIDTRRISGTQNNIH